MDRLATVIQALDSGGADMIHFDVEDGVFVPVMTLGTKILRDLRRLTDKPFDVHLMMVNPEWILPQLIEDGADRISVHYEACPYPRRTLRMIAEKGIPAGIAINPATSLPDLSYLRPYLSFVVVLSSEPEIPDAPFLVDTLEKIRMGKQQAALDGVEWTIDGGVNTDNIQQVVEAGADTIVIGRSIFGGTGDIANNLNDLRKMIAGPGGSTVQSPGPSNH